MTTNAKIASTIQKLAPGKLVTLFELDMTSLGGTTIYFTENVTTAGAIVELNSVEYTPIDCKAEGFEVTGEGVIPQPTFTISNVSQSLVAEIVSYDDLVGAILTRRRTFAKYLDDGDEADSNAQFPVDIWRVQQKTQQNKFFIEWKLTAYMDYEGTYLPKEQVLRDTCTHIYRVWDGSAFDYTDATCPYTGASCFERDGTPTVTEEDDDCGKRYSDCKLRYPLKADVLPTRAFPNVAKVRV